MNIRISFFALIAFLVASCSQNSLTVSEDSHEEVKFQYTVYSGEFELFAEADAFVAGDTANILSHFTILPEFRPLENGKIKVSLVIDGKSTIQILESPTRRGIYSFDIVPQAVGKGTLTFEIAGEEGLTELVIPEVTVYSDLEEAHEASLLNKPPVTNTTFFSKEQSWKIDFASELPVNGPFGQVIKSTAIIKSAPADEIIVSAGTRGIVADLPGKLLEGRDVIKGEKLLTISGDDMAENNFSVKYDEARNNYEKSETDYNRAKELVSDKIISDKELLVIKNQYDNAKSAFENLRKNFTASGQNVTAPLSGSLREVYVKNGTFVEAGQQLLSISQNKKLVLTASVPEKYLSNLSSLKTASLRKLNDKRVYTLEELEGKVLSYGKSANSDNYLIPVNLQITNTGVFTPGTFIEIWLKTFSEKNSLTVSESAIVEEQGVFFVYVQVTPELFEKREVITGNSDGIRIEILKGITENERIVTRGAILIKLAQSTGTLDAHSGHVH